MYNIAIFASGSGSNAENIIRYFQNHQQIHIRLILANNADAFVLERAKNLHVPAVVFSKNDFYKSTIVEDKLNQFEIDFIVLAGFLWLIPVSIIQAYPNKIINIHPALLPKYGGKGMYGSRVHEAVKVAGEKETGITIHYVNENYDDGNIIFQAKCAVNISDTPDSIAKKVHQLEYELFPKIIEQVLLI